MRDYISLLGANLVISVFFFLCFLVVGYPWGYIPGILASTTYFWAASRD